MPKKKGTGVIVGRFQMLMLTPSMKKLIDSVRKKHERTMVFLGSNIAPSTHNPLDFEFRWIMFLEHFGPAVEVFEMPDLPDDRIWSQELDRRILEQKTDSDVTLYGTKDNFIERYSGRHKTHVLEPTDLELEQEVSFDSMRSARDFRAGILYATMRRYPTVYPTVDIAVFRKDFSEILLARKPNESRFRLPGGFVDPTDESFEEAAMRELGEECGELELENLFYVGSARIDDWRYAGSMDAVMTHLYVCELVEGKPEPGDDITELRWVEVSKLRPEIFVPEHLPLLALLEKFLIDEENED